MSPSTTRSAMTPWQQAQPTVSASIARYAARGSRPLHSSAHRHRYARAVRGPYAREHRSPLSHATNCSAGVGGSRADTVPADEPTIILVRMKPGLVGETKRVVHLVRLPESGTVPEELTAYCGERFEPGTIDFLPEPTGMPCVRCLIAAPMPRPPALPPESDESN